MRSFTTVRLLSIFLTTLLVLYQGAGSIGLNPEPADKVQKEIQSEARPVKVGATLLRPAPLDLYGLCLGINKDADTSIAIDINHDMEADIVRFYGAAMANAQQWRKIGPPILAPLKRIAVRRAQRDVVERLGVYVAAEGNLIEGYDSNLTMEDLSTQLNTSDYEKVKANAQGLIRGGHVSKVRFVSLGEQGVCVVVAYDVPINLNPDLESPASPTHMDSAPRDVEQNNFEYQTPPPGSYP